MSQKPFGFSRDLRLLNASDFRTVFDRVDAKAPSEQVLLLARKTDSETSRIGFILSKKNIRRAVSRTRIKRHFREYVRLHQQSLPGMDVIVMGRKGLDALTNPELDKLIQKQFRKLRKRLPQSD